MRTHGRGVDNNFVILSSFVLILVGFVAVGMTATNSMKTEMQASCRAQIEEARSASLGQPVDYAELGPGNYAVRAVAAHSGYRGLAIVDRISPRADMTLLVKNVPPEQLKEGAQFKKEPTPSR